MLTRLVLVCCAAALVTAKPQGARPPAEILEYENNNIGVDGYNFRFHTSDGVARSKTGVLNNVGTENEAMSVTGDISFTISYGQNNRFQTSDGVARSETGVLNNVGTENEAMSVTGDISFTTDDGKKVTIKFVSDENGYRPVVTTS